MADARKVGFTVFLLFISLCITVGILLITIKPWAKKKVIDISLDLPFTEHPHFIKIFTSSDSEIKVNDYSQYRVYRNFDASGEMMFEYQFKSDSKCVEIKYERGSVWKFDEKSIQGYPKSCIFFTGLKRIILYFEYHVSFYSFEDKKWIHQFTARIAGFINLNLGRKDLPGGKFFDDDEPYSVYNPEFGSVFKSVSYAGNVLWKTDNLNTGVKEVIVENLPNGKKTITVHTVYNKTHTFNVD